MSEIPSDLYRPYGAWSKGVAISRPSDESLGYSQSSQRDSFADGTALICAHITVKERLAPRTHPANYASAGPAPGVGLPMAPVSACTPSASSEDSACRCHPCLPPQYGAGNAQWPDRKAQTPRCPKSLCRRHLRVFSPCGGNSCNIPTRGASLYMVLRPHLTRYTEPGRRAGNQKISGEFPMTNEAALAAGGRQGARNKANCGPRALGLPIADCGLKDGC